MISSVDANKLNKIQIAIAFKLSKITIVAEVIVFLMILDCIEANEQNKNYESGKHGA